MKFQSVSAVVAAVAILGLSGCANTSQECKRRVVMGAGIGALGGAAVGAGIGAASGGSDAGQGALIGAGSGAIIGGVVAGLTCKVPSTPEYKQVEVRTIEK
jgi:hypothetical protein